MSRWRRGVGRRESQLGRAELVPFRVVSGCAVGGSKTATVALMAQMFEIQVRIPYFTNIAKDVITNVWHWRWNGGSPPISSDFIALQNAIMGWYEAIFNNTTNAALAPWVKSTGWTLKWYDLDEATPRVPKYVATDTFAGNTAASSTMPPEVSLCVSYQADPQSGFPQASRRGRIYLGGLGAGFSAGTTSTFPLPGATILSNACTASTSLATPGTVPNWEWVVWSRKLHVASLVTNGWVDNAFDTQRRRGQLASARSLWT